MQTERIQADQKRAYVQVSMRSIAGLVSLVVQKHACAYGATGFVQHSLGKFEHEMSQCLAWLIQFAAAAAIVAVVIVS